jgi:hypothetical protein
MQLHPSLPPTLRARHLHSYISEASRTEPPPPTCLTNLTKHTTENSVDVPSLHLQSLRDVSRMSKQ